MMMMMKMNKAPESMEEFLDVKHLKTSQTLIGLYQALNLFFVAEVLFLGLDCILRENSINSTTQMQNLCVI